ncbi:MAG: hypothetical protein ACO1Q7_16775 [Gemmatimonas sp.]
MGQTSPLEAVRAELAVFLAGGEFTPFWDAVANATDAIDADQNIDDDEREWFDELYDAVYMGAEDPIDAKAAAEGMVGASELREQLRAMRLDRSGA